jgi:flagellar biosynthetic protein FlhB
MAEGAESGSKTEEATPHRLEEARKRGDVPKSMELTQTASLAGAFGALAYGGTWMAETLAQQLRPFIAHPESIDVHGQAGVGVTWQLMLAVGPCLALVMGGAMLAGAGGNILQHGILFTTEKLKPDFGRLSLAEGFKRLFGIDGAANFVRSFLKLALTIAVCWWVLAPHASEIPQLIRMEPVALLGYSAAIGKTLMWSVIALLAVGAVIDFIWQRQRFMQRMKMTKEELKEDFRQSEGDPHVKARQRQIRMKLSRQRMIQRVPQATVVVANPTHFAVALRYEQGSTPAPEVIAKGADAVALKIREVAEAAGVPVIEDPPLARALYAAVEVDQIIPHEHYEAVAKIIGFILAGKRGKRRARGL